MSDYIKLQFMDHRQREVAFSIYSALLSDKGYKTPQVIDLYVRTEDASELKQLLNAQDLDYEEVPQ